MMNKAFTHSLIVASLLTATATAEEGDIVNFDFTGPITNGTSILGSDGETTASFTFQSFGGSPDIVQGGAGDNYSNFTLDADNPGDSSLLTVNFSQALNFENGIRMNDWQVFDMEVVAFGANISISEVQNSFKYVVTGENTNTVSSAVTEQGVINYLDRYNAVYSFDDAITGFSIRASDTTFTHFAGLVNDGIQMRWAQDSVTVAPEPSSAVLSLLAAFGFIARRRR